MKNVKCRDTYSGLPTYIDLGSTVNFSPSPKFVFCSILDVSRGWVSIDHFTN